MSIFAIVVLSIVQGLTEFLPVSSKTHLLVTQHLLGMEPDLYFIVVVHAGSLLAVLTYYRRTWLELLGARRREIPLLIVGSIPAVAAALAFKRYLEPLYQDLALASGLLLVNALFLFLSERLGREKTEVGGLGIGKALIIGVAQAAALSPGISRSGSTIGAGYLCGLKRGDAVRFSFFLGAVAIVGALILKTWEALKTEESLPFLPIGIGISVTFAVSLVAIRVVEILSLKGRFSLFALYCAVAGVAGLIHFATRG